MLVPSQQRIKPHHSFEALQNLPQMIIGTLMFRTETYFQLIFGDRIGSNGVTDFNTAYHLKCFKTSFKECDSKKE